MSRRAAREQRRPQWVMPLVIWTVCLAADPITRAVAQPPSAAEPPTIEKIIIDDRGASQIEGEGRPGDVVELISGDAALGEATVSANGSWRVALKEGLQPGTYQIRADARVTGAGARTAGDEIRVAIPAELGRRAVVAYESVSGGELDRATRQRAEALAEGAGKAFDDISAQTSASPNSVVPPAGSDFEDSPAARVAGEGALSVVIDWLKRSARVYREDVVGKLAVATGDRLSPEQAPSAAEPSDAQQAAATIAKEREEAEARRIDVAEAEAERKSAEAEKAAAEASRKEAQKRKQAEDPARKKAEADKRIAEDLERLKKAKEEADRTKAEKAGALQSSPPSQKATITLERFYLPGEKRPREEKPLKAEEAATPAALAVTITRTAAPLGCSAGKVVHRKGRRWYVTGANDTLWDIAERFYGSGLSYPRIYKVNRKRLSSPHVVRPCLALLLPGRR